MTDLFRDAGVAMPDTKWVWHLHGRYLQTVEYGWSRKRIRREVWHFEESCVAATEEEALDHFIETHGGPCPGFQWLHFSRGRELKPDPPANARVRKPRTRA